MINLCLSIGKLFIMRSVRSVDTGKQEDQTGFIPIPNPMPIVFSPI